MLTTDSAERAAAGTADRRRLAGAGRQDLRLALGTVLGVAHLEFRMQVRRRSLWLFAGVLAPIHLLLLLRLWIRTRDATPALLVGNWAVIMNLLPAMLVGVYMADRLTRDAATGVPRLFDALPEGPLIRLLGKYLGATAGATLPVLVVYAAGVGGLALVNSSPAILLVGAAAFLAVNLPGLLFVAAYSLALPKLLSVPVYQVLFVGYYVWGNVYAGHGFVPSLGDTILTPIGWYRANGFFGAGLGGTTTHDATAAEAAASILLLLVLSAAPLYGAWRYLLWERARA